MIGGFSALADDTTQFNATLVGFQATPSILSNGNGSFTASVDPGGTSISYTLTFSDLSSNVTASHIHFAQPGVVGNIIVLLCNSPTKPACPTGGGTVTATITAADVLAAPSQGISAASFSDLLRVLRSGDSYVDVHTTNHPAGEIRGQVRIGED
jgi:hypothetical protein